MSNQQHLQIIILLLLSSSKSSSDFEPVFRLLSLPRCLFSSRSTYFFDDHDSYCGDNHDDRSSPIASDDDDDDDDEDERNDLKQMINTMIFALRCSFSLATATPFTRSA